MFFKVATVLAIVAYVSGAPQHQQAAQFPAGVDPASCPNFPICDNARLHDPKAQYGGQQWNAPAQQWNAPAQQWNAPAAPQQWNAPAAPQQWNAPAAHQQWNAPAAEQQWNAPAAPAYAPNPLWNAGPQANAYAPVSNHLPGAGGDKYPAGVNPHSCPNYPFCDNAPSGHAAQVEPLPGYTERLYPAGVSAHECPNFPYCH